MVTDISVETAFEDDEEAMPTPCALTEDVVIDLYQTPVALMPANRRNKATVMAEPEDTTMESSDTELVAFEDLKE